jgi:sigma-B regulation protein RsbU (phosphoserine phosphatase)
LLGYLNNRLARAYARNGTFVTAFYAVLDPSMRTLTYSRAGHNPPRLVRRGRVVSLDKNGALPMGIAEEETYDHSTVTMERGDLLLLYTDGIVETMTPLKGAAHRELFGLDRLDKVLLDCGTSSAAACIERIRAAVSAFAEHAPPTDDQTLLAIRCLPS